MIEIYFLLKYLSVFADTNLCILLDVEYCFMIIDYCS